MRFCVLAHLCKGTNVQSQDFYSAEQLHRPFWRGCLHIVKLQRGLTRTWNLFQLTTTILGKAQPCTLLVSTPTNSLGVNSTHPTAQAHRCTTSLSLSHHCPCGWIQPVCRCGWSSLNIKVVDRSCREKTPIHMLQATGHSEHSLLQPDC